MSTTPSANAPSSGLPRYIKRISADGLLFVGDPQMTCVTPGRRMEEDFLAVTIDKIRQCREIAEKNNLFIVFLGDMFDNPDAKKANTQKVVENTNRMIADYVQAMNFMPSVTIVGNHDKKELRLTSGTTLATLRDLRMIDVIEPGGPYAVIDIQGTKVGLGGTPYGESIPKDIRNVFQEPVDRAIWLTHSQFQFDLDNPYLPEIFPIQGCDMVVNGHDHTTQKPKAAGQTWWFNPGNITRLSVDTLDHVPSSWEWNPSMPAGHLKQHVLRYAKHVFNLEGRQAPADVEAATTREIKRTESLFAQMIRSDDRKNQTPSEMDRSSSGDLILEDIDRILEENTRFSEGAQATVRNLHQRAPERMKL